MDANESMAKFLTTCPRCEGVGMTCATCGKAAPSCVCPDEGLLVSGGKYELCEECKGAGVPGVSVVPSVAPRHCFRCDETCLICDICGESQAACQCADEDMPSYSDCPDCGGTDE